MQARCNRLLVFENGVGAINLPYDESQIGADHSRAVHPRALREFGELASLVAGCVFQVENPCAWKTKAEMLAEPALGAVAPVLGESFSCDSFPFRKRDKAQCGFCTSCILRRLALEAAGRSDPGDRYVWDLRSRCFPSDRLHQRGLSAMEWQVARLRPCLARTNPWRALCREFPALRSAPRELTADADPCATEARLVRLYAKHVAEWETFSGRASLAWLRDRGAA